MRPRRFVTAIAVAFALSSAPAAWAQQILVDFYVPANMPNTGFADPTPAAPVGGNPGVTLGQQRIFVFLQAAAIWTEILKPKQDIYVAAQFEPLGPNVLGSAGPTYIHANFPNAELTNTWHYDALADHHAGVDLSPPTYDIVARFSFNAPFYLGFDNNEAPNQSDLLVTVLHEIGHGLNFGNAVNEATGSIPTPDPTVAFGDVFSQYTMDVTTNKGWNTMTAAERAVSAINVRNVSWSGLHVKLNQHRVLERGEPAVRVLSPPGSGPLMLGEASFGPPLTSTGVTGHVVLAESATGTTGCDPILNDVSGKIALIDRGVCAFTIKVMNAQNAGAIGVLIADNVFQLPPPGLGGADPLITIPSGRIGLPDANAIKAQLASGVRVRMLVDKTVLAGTDRTRRQVMLAAFNPVIPGSSISHFEPVASPNQIMEPAINPDLTSSLEPPTDLTLPLLTDLGWFTDRDGVHDGVDLCLGSNTAATVVVQGCDSGVPNPVGATGCTVADAVNACDRLKPWLRDACVVVATTVLRTQGVLTRAQQSAINACALKH
jgi:hypothetical protein